MPTQFVPSTVSICNTALRHIAVGRVVTALTDNTEEARALNQFYDQARDEVLREFHWPFARRYASLTLVGGTSTLSVTLDWQYSYRMPADCLQPKRLLDRYPNRNEIEESKVPYWLGADATGGLIYTDVAAVALTQTSPALPVLEYTTCVTTESAFPADFAQAFALRLANYVTPQLTQGDVFKIGQRVQQLYEIAITRAQANAANGEQPDPRAESLFIQGR